MAEKKEIVSQTSSEKFTSMVFKEFTANAGELTWGIHQKKLAQHLFIKVDQALTTLETKRQNDPKKSKNAPIIWNNLDLKKLAIDAVNRIELGLDALIENHIHPIPYWNSSKKQYDLNLQIGYEGLLYYKRAIALDPPKDVRVELVYKTDHFKPIKKSIKNDVESYEFEIKEPFNRGEVIGGFGYLVFDDPSKNKLILVPEESFKKSEDKGNTTFWKNHPVEMRYTKLVTRITSKIPSDPDKITNAVIEADKISEETMINEINENANQEVIDIESEPEKKEEPSNKKVPSKNNKLTLTDKQQELMNAVNFAGEEIANKAWEEGKMPNVAYDQLSDDQCSIIINKINSLIDKSSEKQSNLPGF